MISTSQASLRQIQYALCSRCPFFIEAARSPRSPKFDLPLSSVASQREGRSFFPPKDLRTGQAKNHWNLIGRESKQSAIERFVRLLNIIFRLIQGPLTFLFFWCQRRLTVRCIKKSPKQETGLRNRERLKVLSGTTLQIYTVFNCVHFPLQSRCTVYIFYHIQSNVEITLKKL